MADDQGTYTAIPGWYADPSGLPRQRWWDGTTWTDHLHDPALEVYGAVARPPAGPETPVYNLWVWLIVLAPILSSSSLVFFDMRAYLMESVTGATTINVPYLLIQLLGWVLYGVGILFAFLDWRSLRRGGFPQQFHWAWSFLSPLVYLIGRAVVLKRQGRRAWAPVWAQVAAGVVTAAFVTFQLIDGLMAVMPLIRDYS